MSPMERQVGFQQLDIPPPTLRDRSRLRALEASGRTPRDFLLDNMLFWARRAAWFDKEAIRTWENSLAYSEDDKQYLDEAAQKKYQKKWDAAMREREAAIDNLIQARDKLQSCAVKAAPYCHPRMLAIAMRNMADDGFFGAPAPPEGSTSNVLPMPANTPEELTKHYLKLVAGR